MKWRGELLRSVADLFEREKHALLAELRSCVIEAQGESDEPSATSRLESLERKIRNQVRKEFIINFLNSVFVCLWFGFGDL